MSYALPNRTFASDHKGGFLLSAIVHGAVLVWLTSGLVFLPKTPIPQLAIEAVVVDESTLNRVADAERQKQAAEAQRRREQERKRQEAAAAAERRKVEERQQQLAAERKKDEVEQQAKLEQQRKAAEQEQLRKADDARKAEEARVVAERARVEKEQEAARQRAIEDRKRREAEARAEAERQRLLEEAERQEQARRESELAAAMAAEDELLAASQSGEMNRYIALIQQQVERNWNRPATARAGLECEVAVQQLRNGDVIDVRISSCNGDAAVRRSIEAAVYSSSPLPLPDNALLFDRNLTFIFRPQEG